MSPIFFSRHSKFHVNSKNLSAIVQKVDGDLDNLIEICNDKFSLLLGEYS